MLTSTRYEARTQISDQTTTAFISNMTRNEHKISDTGILTASTCDQLLRYQSAGESGDEVKENDVESSEESEDSDDADADEQITSGSSAFELNNARLFNGLCADQLKERKDRLWTLLDDLEKLLKIMPLSKSAKWLKALKKLRDSDIEAQTVIGVRGGTGFGKSSMINALLGQAQLLPTSPLESTTAIVTQVSHHDRADFKAIVEFKSREEFRRELSSIKDLCNNGEDLPTLCRDSQQAATYHLFAAVYPHLTLPDLCTWSLDQLMAEPCLKDLGNSRELFMYQAEDLHRELRKLMSQQSNQTQQGPSKQAELWPLVRVINITSAPMCCQRVPSSLIFPVVKTPTLLEQQLPIRGQRTAPRSSFLRRVLGLSATRLPTIS